MIKLPGLEIREPLRRRPFAGAFIGGFAGLLLGVMAAAVDAFPATDRAVVTGDVLGGLAVGAIVGVFAPEFRKRWLAGLIVGAAAVVGFVIAVPMWGEDWGLPLNVFMGCISGIVYSGLLWDYQPVNEHVQPTSFAESHE